MTPEEALRLFADVQGRTFVAMHWGTFDMTEEPIKEPPMRLHAVADRLELNLAKIWVLKHGEARQWVSPRPSQPDASPPVFSFGASS